MTRNHTDIIERNLSGSLHCHEVAVRQAQEEEEVVRTYITGCICEVWGYKTFTSKCPIKGGTLEGPDCALL